MPQWTSDELIKIGNAEELEIASRRSDGTLRSPRTIWVARDGDDLHIRSVNGRTSAWFRGTQARHEGHIRAGGGDKTVTFEEVDADHALNDSSMPRTAASIAAMLPASSSTSRIQRHEPRLSNWSRVQQALSTY